MVTGELCKDECKYHDRSDDAEDMVSRVWQIKGARALWRSLNGFWRNGGDGDLVEVGGTNVEYLDDAGGTNVEYLDEAGGMNVEYESDVLYAEEGA
jgi:hypothetical protein